MKTTLNSFLICTLFFFHSGNAQKCIKKGDLLFKQNHFMDALNQYQFALDNGYSADKLYPKIAETYYFLIDYENSYLWNKKVFDLLGENTPSRLYKYHAEVSMNSGKYQEAIHYSEKYQSCSNQTINDGIPIKERIKWIQLNNDSIQSIHIWKTNIETGGRSMGICYDQNSLIYSSPETGNYKDQTVFYNLAYTTPDGLNSDFPKNDLKKTQFKYYEGTPSVTKDGLELYYSGNGSEAKKYFENQIEKKVISDDSVNVLMIYKLEKVDGKWSNKQLLPFNDRNYDCSFPFINDNGDHLFFASNMPGGYGGYDLYVSELVDGAWSVPHNLGEEINTTKDEIYPFLHGDSLIFSSNGKLGFGGFDLYCSQWKDKKASNCKNLKKPFNSSHDDFAMIVKNIDGATSGYFSSNRRGNNGYDHIYGFKKRNQIQISGYILDAITNKPIPNAKVSLLGVNNEVLDTINSFEDGRYSFSIDPSKSYSINTYKDEYQKNRMVLSNSRINDPELKEGDFNVLLDKKTIIRGIIKNGKDGQPISGVKITFRDPDSQEEIASDSTSISGEFIAEIEGKKIGDSIHFIVTLSKEGYFFKTIDINETIPKNGSLELESNMDSLVKYLREIVKINPINFDLGKWDIRPDATVELNKVVEIMNKYPNMIVELGSHTDCRASKSFNMNLSHKRAKSSANYIRSRIVNPDRIYGKGYGELQLLNECECEGAVKSTCTEEEHQQNRRTEFKVILVGKSKKTDIEQSDVEIIQQETPF